MSIPLEETNVLYRVPASSAAPDIAVNATEPPLFPPLSDASIDALFADINRNGFGVIRDCVPPAQLATMQDFVQRQVADNGGQYLSLAGPDSVSGTYLQALSASAEFRRVCRALCGKATGTIVPDTGFYQVLRCLSGTKGARHSYFFHFDSFVLTALVPILIPAEGPPGDLLMFPNVRPVRSSYVGNLLDKLLLDNKLTQILLKRGVLANILHPVKVRMDPGHIYLFWGYRSVHANEPCEPDKIRSTALFHYLNPHAGSSLRRALR